MADDTTRIINLTEATEIDSGMNFVTDSSTGTRRLVIGKLLDYITQNFTGKYDSTSAYAVGDFCTYNGILYECNTAITTGGETWNSAHWTQVNVGDKIIALRNDVLGIDTELDQKADIDGTIANAKQLESTIKIPDSSPYNFRTSGGSVDIGDREYLEVVGGSLGRNQLIQATNIVNTKTDADITFTKNSTSLTVSGTANESKGITITGSIPVSNNHVFLIKTQGLTKGQVYTGYSNLGYDTGSGKVISWTHGAYVSLVLEVVSGETYDMILAPQLIDLTLLFGSTIADYVYTLESGTAGAGIAWLKRYINLDKYIPYQTPTFAHVENVTGHKMTGFNQWDEIVESGEINATTGQNEESTNYWRTKNYTRIFPNTSYCVSGPTIEISTLCRTRFYDADKNYIGYRDAGGSQVYFGIPFTTPTNAYYVRMAFPDSSIPSGTDICINLHWDGERDGEYEPYEEHVYSLDDSVVLRGIPKLDASNNLYYDGDTYESDGTVTRRYGIVDLGTLTWERLSTNTQDKYRFGAVLSNSKMPSSTGSEVPNIICSAYMAITPNNSYTRAKVGITINYVNNLVVVYDSNYEEASATTFKTAMSGVYLVYELATPTTEQASPFTSPQIVNDWGTEEFTGTCLIPVGNNTDYTPNLRAKLEMAPNSPSGDGLYGVRQSSGLNSYELLENELPADPTTDGTYTLKAVVSGGVMTKQWVSET